MKEEKVLTQEEALAVMHKLQMKFGADIERVQNMIKKDIEMNGFVSLETSKEQMELHDKILKEKESNEYQDS